MEAKIELEANGALKALQNLTSQVNVLTSALFKVNDASNMSKLTSNADNMASKLGTIKKALNFGGMIIGARKAYTFVKDIAGANIDMIETNNFFEVSMGRVVDEYGNLNEEASQYYTKAINFQNELNDKLHTNMAQMKGIQSQFYSLYKTQGVNKDSAYFISEQLTKAAIDMASLNNTDIDTMSKALVSGITGQVESLRNVARVDITESSLQPILDSLGIDRSVQQLSYAEKEVARYIAIINQAGQAQADFAKTFDSPANQIRIMKNEFAELRQVAGAFVVNTFGKVLVYVNAAIMVVKELLKSLASLFGYDLNFGGGSVDLATATGVDDLNSGLGSASKKAKELKKQLMGFDEINNIDPNSQTKGGSGSGGTSGGVDSKLLDALKEWDSMLDKIHDKSKEIRDKWLDWLGVTDGTYDNLKKILEIVKAVGIAFLTWKISSTIFDLLKKLNIFKGNSFQMAFGITLAVSGLYLLWKGTKRLLNGDVDLFSILETIAGGAMSTFGIANILRSINNGKVFSWGRSLMIGFGITLAVQGVEVLMDGVKKRDIGKIILGGTETIAGVATTISGLLPVIKNVKNKVVDLGSNIANSFKIGKHAVETTSGSFIAFGKKAGTLAIGLAGVAVGSLATYDAMKSLTTGTKNAGIAFVELAGGLALATGSGAVAGYQAFGYLGGIIGGVAGITTSAITAILGYKDGIQSLDIPTTTLTSEIEEMTQKLEANREAHKNAMNAIQESYDSKLVDAEYSQNLSAQLDGLVDANGRVKKGYEDRVNYILNELNNALGTEYGLNNGLITKNGEVIGSYEGLQKSISDTIMKFKEEAEAQAYQEFYKESIKEGIRLKKEEQEISRKRAEAEQEYSELMAKGYSKWTLEHNEDCKQIIQNYIDATEESTKTSEAIIKNASEQSEYYGKYLQIMSQDTENLKNDLNKNGEEITQNTKNTLEKTEEEINKKSPIVQNKIGDMATKSTQKHKEGIEPIDTNTGKKVDSMMDIIKNKIPMAQQTSEKLARTVEGGIKTIDTTEAGRQTVEGVAVGIDRNKGSARLWDSLNGLKNFVVGSVKTLFGIHSPSKVMADLAQYIPEGFAQGISDNSYQAIKSAKEMAESVNTAIGKTTDIEMFQRLNEGIRINTKDFAVDSTQYVNYGAITGSINAQAKIDMGTNLKEDIVNAVKQGMRESTVNIEAKTEEGVIVQKASQGFTEYVRQTGDLPFPVPV